MIWVMIHRLIGDKQLGCGGYWLAAAGIARKAWVRPAGHLDAQPLPFAEAVRGWPERDVNVAHPIARWRFALRRKTQDAITEIDRFTRLLDDTEPGKEVRVIQAGAHIKVRCHRPDDLHLALQRIAGVDQH